MPIYEFCCARCNTKTTILVRNTNEPLTTQCASCGSGDLIRVIPSFSYHKSQQTIWEESGEPRRSTDLDYYRDPRNIGRWTEKRLKELGLEIPSQIQEEIQAAREGELPKSLKDEL